MGGDISVSKLVVTQGELFPRHPIMVFEILLQKLIYSVAKYFVNYRSKITMEMTITF